MESQFVVVRLVPSHLLMFVDRRGSIGLSIAEVVPWRFSVDRLAIFDRYELSFCTLLEGVPLGEVLRLPGILFDRLALEGRWPPVLCAAIFDLPTY